MRSILRLSHRYTGTVDLAGLILCGCQAKRRPDRLGVPEAGRHVNGGAIGQRDYRANAGGRHQAPTHVIVPDDGQQAPERLSCRALAKPNPRQCEVRSMLATVIRAGRSILCTFDGGPVAVKFDEHAAVDRPDEAGTSVVLERAISRK